MGTLVMEWPTVVGAEGCGVVVETGEGCTRLKKGDLAYCCIRVGQNAYSTFQDSFLVDEDLAIKKGDNLSVEDVASMGVGLMVRKLLLPPLRLASFSKGLLDLERGTLRKTRTIEDVTCI
jgi:NADPH:quinone reductase-like Zn-dependent oxidoreductase